METLSDSPTKPRRATADVRNTTALEEPCPIADDPATPCAPAPLHILFLSDNFPPESNAPASRTYEHAREWVRQGHRVTVITGCPNFPQGRPYAGFHNRWYARDQIDGIDVVRVKTFIAANEGVFLRTLDYLSFMVSAFFASFLQRDVDVVVATSPQPFTAIGGRLVALCRRRPFVLEIRDLWPASIVAVGAMRESRAIRLMERVEQWLYRSATAIVVVTHAFRDTIVAHGIKARTVHVVPNAVDGHLFRSTDKDRELLARHGLEHAFVVGYFGTHGMAHDLPRVLEAVERLRDHPRIRFVFCGAGAARAELEATVAKRKLTNVTLLPACPRDQVGRWLNCCDASLVPLRDSPVFAEVVPSKLFECQATGTPVIMALPPGEATRMVETAGCGIVVPPGDPVALAQAVLALEADPEHRRRMAEAALVAAGSATRELRAAQMLAVLQRCAAVRQSIEVAP